MDDQHWAVARIFAKRAQRIREEAEEMECGVSAPIFKRRRYVAGQQIKTDHPLLPGYLFIRVRPDDRARIVELDGVYNLLLAGVRGSERLAEEMALMEFRAIGGDFNELEAAPQPPTTTPADRRSSRRHPRRSKRARKRLRIERSISP